MRKRHLAGNGLATWDLDLYKFDDLAHEDDEVKLALELTGRAVHIKTLDRLLARLDEVLNDLWLDLELVLES